MRLSCDDKHDHTSGRKGAKDHDKYQAGKPKARNFLVLYDSEKEVGEGIVLGDCVLVYAEECGCILRENESLSFLNQERKQHTSAVARKRVLMILIQLKIVGGVKSKESNEARKLWS